MGSVSHFRAVTPSKRVRRDPLKSAVFGGMVLVSQARFGGMGVFSSVRAINRLTDRKVRSFIGATREGTAEKKKLADGGGLFLTVTPAGTPVWRIKYRHGGKEKLFAAGTYPSVGLEAAREQRERVKAQLQQGRDPTQARRLERATAVAASSNTFEGIARAWLDKRKAAWSDIHFRQSERALERDVFPMIGKLPVAAITSPMVAAVIERIANRGAIETAG